MKNELSIPLASVIPFSAYKLSLPLPVFTGRSFGTTMVNENFPLLTVACPLNKTLVCCEKVVAILDASLPKVLTAIGRSKNFGYTTPLKSAVIIPISLCISPEKSYFLPACKLSFPKFGCWLMLVMLMEYFGNASCIPGSPIRVNFLLLMISDKAWLV